LVWIPPDAAKQAPKVHFSASWHNPHFSTPSFISLKAFIFVKMNLEILLFFTCIFLSLSALYL